MVRPPENDSVAWSNPSGLLLLEKRHIPDPSRNFGRFYESNGVEIVQENVDLTKATKKAPVDLCSRRERNELRDGNHLNIQPLLRFQLVNDGFQRLLFLRMKVGLLIDIQRLG
jgi:hypothetical protein